MPKFKAELFHQHDSILAEGPVWHRARCSLVWVDILRNELWEKALDGRVRKWSLKYTTSAIFERNGCDQSVWLVTNFGIVLFKLDDEHSAIVYPLGLPFSMRTNDAGLLKCGTLVFGTMEKVPRVKAGALFKVEKGIGVTELATGIGIPNGIIALEDKIYISDSLIQKTYGVLVLELLNGNVDFDDLTDVFFHAENDETPDGGCIDSEGNIWIAIWGGGCVVCLDTEGQVLQRIELPIRQPSSCCFGGVDGKTLFITSAAEGLTKVQIETWPLSGSIFSCEVGVSGNILPYVKL